MNPIDYLINEFMIPFLRFSYDSIYPNYGIAILLLTILVKILFVPLTQKQFKAMKETQKIQPEIKKIQEKYKGQPDKASKEMMQLWKTHKVNPLGGCLPALVQLPVFIAIFYTIKSPGFNALISQEGINRGLFSFWIPDLTLPDTFMVLPIFIALATYISQKMTITDPKQATLMMFMPFMMFFLCLKMPGGVLLYWAASQVLSSIHQYIVMRPALAVTVKE